VPIKPTLVEPDKERLKFLPKFFPHVYLRVEMAIYDSMQRMCKEYEGGYWHMYTLSNGACYMTPAIEEMELVVDTNCYRGKMSGDAAGLVTCLFVFNQLCWNNPQNSAYVDLFYKLKDFAMQHKEADEILQAID
jgi:hypothetical protein